VNIHRTDLNDLSILKGQNAHYIVMNEQEYEQGVRDLEK
tara:strand:- start:1658 stop:1774 length:117 start_codon:yes stop_codon:yes gene_type:complete